MASEVAQIRSHEELPRVLTATNALAIVVGIIIGSGIFLVPREMMAAVGSSRMVYAVWITGGLLSLFGAMSYAEVAAMRPRVGGEYAFLHDAYGPLTAFLYTWTWTMIAKPASIATIAAGLMRVLGTFPIFAFLDHAAVGHLMWSQVMAIVATWLITGLNIVSTRDSAQVQTLLTWLKVVMILVIAGLCFASVRYGDWHNFSSEFRGARGGFAGFMIALIAALWAYDGWSDVSQMAGEVQKPQRSLPVALIGGVTIVGALYMLTNAAIQYVLPSAAIAVDGPAGYRRAATCRRKSWGGTGRSRDGGEHLRDVCGQLALGCESPVCGGSRPAISVRAGTDSSALQDAVGEPAAAGCAQFPAAAGDWKIPGAVLAGDLLGVAVLRAHCRDGICVSRARAERQSTLSGDGISCGSGTVYFGGAGVAGLQLHGSATRVDCGRAGDSVWRAGALSFSAEQGSGYEGL